MRDESGGGAIREDGELDFGSGETSFRTRSARFETPTFVYRRRTYVRNGVSQSPEMAATFTPL